MTASASTLHPSSARRGESPLIRLGNSRTASPRGSIHEVAREVQSPASPGSDLDKYAAGDDHAASIRSERPKSGAWRRVLGWLLLGSTVLMWTISNFLFSFMFADMTWSKPLFVTYINCASFVCALPFILLGTKRDERQLWRTQLREWPWREEFRAWRRTFPAVLKSKLRFAGTAVSGLFGQRVDYTAVDQGEPGEFTLSPGVEQHPFRDMNPPASSEPLTLPQTIVFSCWFAPIWFLANYFTAYCFEFTSVASGTVIVSTSSFWALLIGRIYQVEHINWQKLIGVFGSLIGVLIIFGNDLWGNNNDADHRGDFPHKSRAELAIGSIMALVSAIMYGVYGTFVKKTIGDESQANMPLIFTLVGLINTVVFAPVLLLFHLTGLETFELPPSSWVTFELLINSAISVVSDYCWFYAVLLTSPVIVTVVLSFTIPITLVGQVVSRDQYATPLNVVGSLLVLVASIVVQLEWSSGEGAGDVHSVETAGPEAEYEGRE